MTVTRLARLLGYIPATAWRAARSPLVCCSVRKMSSQGEKSKPIKQSHKKPKVPEGRFDAPEDPNLEKEPLTNTLLGFVYLVTNETEPLPSWHKI
ncbi:succinate dehydrogenase assembly factor 4, mitochondrial isoform X2 [Panthera leo]|uniref:succinate dehydrogenase assembly factor 4, mitochondrial isoform X2 n=1 Tax=Panthera leo TaxID=9689 RepID=UPI001C6A30DB|nr:succinate dehydrogenase assembly factor 4, mitochondrial isoform X2 [Panthera leo]